MKLNVNGEKQEVPDGLTIADLLVHLHLDNRPVAVEVNLILVPKKQHLNHCLEADDRIEIVTLVGGG